MTSITVLILGLAMLPMVLSLAIWLSVRRSEEEATELAAHVPVRVDN